MAFTPVFEIILGLWLVGVSVAIIAVLIRLDTIETMVSYLENEHRKVHNQLLGSLDSINRALNGMSDLLKFHADWVQSLDDQQKKASADIASIANSIRYLKTKELQSLEREAKKLAAGKK